MTTFILILLLIFIIYQLTKSNNKTIPSDLKEPVKIKYKCQDCGHQFISAQDINSCPNCSSNIIDELATMAGLYMPGDWLGFWGNDAEDISSSSNSFDDPWNDGSDSFDDGDEYSSGFDTDDYLDEYDEE